MEKDSLKADLTTYALDYSFGSTTIFAGRQSFTFGKPESIRYSSGMNEQDFLILDMKLMEKLELSKDLW